LGDKPLFNNDIKVVIDYIVAFQGKKAITVSGNKIEYEKLVLATGSYPGSLPIEGAELISTY